MPRQIRRVVTRDDESGKSEVLIDARPSQIIGPLTELWLTDGTPANHADDRVDQAKRSTRLEPPRGGTVFRFVRIAPESEEEHLSREERQRRVSERFGSMGATHVQPGTSRHPKMHQTQTTDYVIVLSGRVTLVLDKEERDLEPFDVVVQRGTNHAWVNRGSEDALLAGVLVNDGRMDRFFSDLSSTRF